MKLQLLLPLLGLALAQDPVPTWPSSYKVKGVLSIPFAEIMEPFAAWVDLGHEEEQNWLLWWYGENLPERGLGRIFKGKKRSFNLSKRS